MRCVCMEAAANAMDARSLRCGTVCSAPGVPSSSPRQDFSCVVKRRMIAVSRCRWASARPVASGERVQPANDDEALRFGHLEIRPGERVLRLNGESAAVGARAFDLLLA